MHLHPEFAELFPTLCKIFAEENTGITGGELGTAVAVVIGSIGTAAVSFWRFVISPAIGTLKATAAEIQVGYEKRIDALEKEIKDLRTEADQRVKDTRTEYEERIEFVEARHSVMSEKMDNELAECQREREQAILWRARYEQRIHELEKVSLEGKVTAVPDDKGVLCVATANLAVSKMFGYTRHELIGMPVENLIAPSFRDKHKEKVSTHSPVIFSKFNRVINGGFALHKDGTKFPVMVEIDSTLVNGVPGWSAVVTIE